MVCFTEVETSKRIFTQNQPFVNWATGLGCVPNLLRCWQARTHDDLETMHWHFSRREVAETPQEERFSTLGQLLDLPLAKLRERRADKEKRAIFCNTGVD